MGNYRVYVYAICKNEAKFAARWYASMSEADGVYVLDTGSQDESVAILRALGAQVQQKTITPWRFDTARNHALALVPQDADICVCTDLDEEFTPGWRAQLEKAWQPGTQQALYKYVWSFQADGQEGTVFYLDKIHARNGFYWKNAVHEVLHFPTQPVRVQCEGMQLNHHPDPEKSRAQYLPLLELSVQENPFNDRNMHYLGREYMYYGRWDDCIATLQRHLSLPTATWHDERCASYRYMAVAYAQKGDTASQERMLLCAVAEAPYLREPWLDLSRLAYAQQDYATLLYACTRALRIETRPLTYISEAASFGALPYDYLSLAYWGLGLPAQALDAAQKALSLDPGNERILQNIALMQKNTLA